MSEEKTAGLLLQSIPYLGQQKILKVFTPDHGLLSFFAKSPKLQSTPFCIAEWVYRKTQKEIHPLLDTTLIDPLLELRQNYGTLTAAGAIARDLLRSQLPGKKAVELYALTCLYLKKLPASPEIFAASFSLKLLLHEGLLSSQREPAFTPEEWEQVAVLAFARQFSLLEEMKKAPLKKIGLFFEERLNQS